MLQRPVSLVGSCISRACIVQDELSRSCPSARMTGRLRGRKLPRSSGGSSDHHRVDGQLGKRLGGTGKPAQAHAFSDYCYAELSLQFRLLVKHFEGSKGYTRWANKCRYRLLILSKILSILQAGLHDIVAKNISERFISNLFSITILHGFNATASRPLSIGTARSPASWNTSAHASLLICLTSFLMARFSSFSFLGSLTLLVLTCAIHTIRC